MEKSCHTGRLGRVKVAHATARLVPDPSSTCDWVDGLKSCGVRPVRHLDVVGFAYGDVFCPTQDS